jgi:hypothetical protein
MPASDRVALLKFLELSKKLPYAYYRDLGYINSALCSHVFASLDPAVQDANRYTFDLLMHHCAEYGM